MAGFKVQESLLAFTIQCDADLDAASSPELIELINSYLVRLADNQATQQAIALDFKDIARVDLAFLREITPVTKSLRGLGKRLLAIRVPRETAAFLRDSGMDSAIQVVENIAAVLGASAKAVPKSFTVDVSFLNPFIEGTLLTLEMQCSIKAIAGKMYLKGKGPELVAAIAGVLGITSSAFTGSIALCFPEKTFLAIMEKLVGETYSEINKEVEDGAGELLNIIFGHAKRVLNDGGYDLAKAIPTVVRGQGLAVKHLTPSPTIVLPFETPVGSFHVEISVDGGLAI